MSNYTKATNFASKDALASGNPLKIVKGTEIDTEFNAIATAVNSKIEGYNTSLTGLPTAPTAASSVYTTQLATTAFVHDVLPRGIIMLWSGSAATVPSGWTLCNGSNSTPDLRDRFIVGAGTTYAVAATGGSKDAVVVSHTHSTDSVGAHQHFTYKSAQLSPNTGGSSNLTSTNYAGSTTLGQTDYAYAIQATGSVADIGLTSSAGTHAHSITTTGVSGTNANLPPYYALCYIMKTTGI